MTTPLHEAVTFSNNEAFMCIPPPIYVTLLGIYFALRAYVQT